VVTIIKNGVFMMLILKKFTKCLKGTTAIEYGLIAAGISLAIVGAVYTFGDNLEALFQWMIGVLPV